MADPLPNPDTSNDTRGLYGGSAPGTPRWVKVFGIVFLVLVLLIVIMMVGGQATGHGPGRHMSGAGLGSQTPTLQRRGI